MKKIITLRDIERIAHNVKHSLLGPEFAYRIELAEIGVYDTKTIHSILHYHDSRATGYSNIARHLSDYGCLVEGDEWMESIILSKEESHYRIVVLSGIIGCCEYDIAMQNGVNTITRAELERISDAVSAYTRAL